MQEKRMNGTTNGSGVSAGTILSSGPFWIGVAAAIAGAVIIDRVKAKYGEIGWIPVQAEAPTRLNSAAA